MSFKVCENINDKINEYTSPLLSCAQKAGEILHPHNVTITAVVAVATALFTLLSAPNLVIGSALAGLTCVILSEIECCSSLAIPFKAIDEFAQKLMGQKDAIMPVVGAAFGALFLLSPATAMSVFKVGLGFALGVVGTMITEQMGQE